MDWNTITNFIVNNLNIILGVALFIAVMYVLYLKIIISEKKELIQDLNNNFSEKRIAMFEVFTDVFKSYIIESQGKKSHEMSEELDQAVREFLVDSALLNAEKNHALSKQWLKILNEPGPKQTKKVIKLFLKNIENMRAELGLPTKAFHADALLNLVHGEYAEEKKEEAFEKKTIEKAETKPKKKTTTKKAPKKKATKKKSTTKK